MNFDANGVPWLKDEKIEQIAHKLLRLVEPSCLDDADTTPIPKIIAFLEQNKGLKVVHEKDLGFVNGRMIRGITQLKEGVILLDADLAVNNQAMYFMTAAHEIGHWSLHRSKIITINDGQSIKRFEDDEYSFWDQDELNVVKRKKDLTNPIDRLEHQAKVFAANLLMPRETFIKAVMALQYNLGGSLQHLGKIYLTDHRHDYYHRLVARLQEVFNVSKQAVSVRLKELGMVVDSRGKKLINKETLRAESIRFEQEQEWRR